MKRKPTEPTLYLPTLVDKAGTRHIIPAKDSAAYCGAVGSQHFPHDHKAAELCEECRKALAAEQARARMERFFER
jgi:hypothetical protein